jgi:hypothetical protein
MRRTGRKKLFGSIGADFERLPRAAAPRRPAAAQPPREERLAAAPLYHYHQTTPRRCLRARRGTGLCEAWLYLCGA